MDLSSLLHRRAGRKLGHTIEHHQGLESTNSRAAELLREGAAKDGLVILADRQTAGRGTGGRSWISDNDDGLWFSVVRTRLPACRPLPFLPALALVTWAREQGLEAHLKWPNDLLIDGRKAAGVLLESQGGGYVIGIGLNLNHEAFPEEVADTATSALMADGRRRDRLGVLDDLLDHMEQIEAEHDDLVPAFRDHCRMIGRRVRFRGRDDSGGQVLIRGLDDDGHLVVEDEQGAVDTWVSGSALRFIIEDC